MRWVQQLWFRWVDRELDRPLAFLNREAMEQGEWNHWVGEAGERLAAKQLWRQGFKVLYRNFRPKEGGEVDIVARHGDILVFTEVKTRTTEQFGRPSEAVDRGKQQLVIRGANAWIRELNHPELLFRFDIVEVLLLEGERPEVRVNEDAFTTQQAGLGM